jgi:hypothetical protein
VTRPVARKSGKISALLVLVVALGLLLLLATRRAVRPLVTPTKVLASSKVVRARSELHQTIYPFSIVPGGIRSIDELRRAMASSPEIYEHFANFDFDHARYGRVTGCYFVSFLDHGIRWTKKCIWLNDEPMITDGKFTILLRCANRVSDKPQVPAEDVDISQPIIIPAPAVTGWPSRPLLSSTDPLPAPTSSPGGTGGDPPGCCPLVGFPGNDPRPVPVPEPSTVSMIGLGVLGLALIYGLSLRKSKA